ncbi:MAG: DUF1616 domain-containing protein [Candidatus Bathyarchaeia archaeon]
MVPTQTETTAIESLIIETIKTAKPATTKQLVKLIREKISLPEKEIIKLIIELENQNKINLTTPPEPPAPTIIAYMVSRKASWYWITIVIAVATAIAVFTIPEEAYPLVYARQALGVIFVLWLPGYAFIKALFPVETPIKTSSESLDKIERIALSLGMSLALVPIVGLILNYTPWGIRLTPITLSLLALTTITATVAVLREHQATKQ